MRCSSAAFTCATTCGYHKNASRIFKTLLDKDLAMQSSAYCRVLPTLGLLAYGALGAGCAAITDLHSDHDPGSDFGAYRTYNYVPATVGGTAVHASVFHHYMTQAIDREMARRGYVKSDTPDLLVDPSAVLEEKTRQAGSGSSYPSYRSHDGSRYGPWSRYGYVPQQAWHYSYLEGTFNIDIIDARKKRLVWRAEGTGRVPQQEWDDLGRSVGAEMPQFFASYRYVAGNPAPNQFR